MTLVYIGLGSNLENPIEQIQRAFQELSTLPGSTLRAHSSMYRSKAVGPGEQEDYVNAAAELDTRLSPMALLGELQELEQRHGRIRGERWGPRTLDLDILLYGDTALDLPQLKIPHPGLEDRPFVIMPLCELNNTLILPSGRHLASLLNDDSSSDCWRIE